MTDQPAFDLDAVLPAWEANYEPGNVSDYLIGYANSEAAAKGAAIAWVTSQTDKDPASLEWVEMPVGDQHDHWYDLIQNHDDGIPTDTGVNVRRRLPATIRDAARQAGGQPGAELCGCGLQGPHEPSALCGPAAAQPDPTIADDPTPLRWGLGDVLHSDDGTLIVCLSGPDREPYWLELDPERAAALRGDLAAPAAPTNHDSELTAAERKFLAWALGCAAAVMFSEGGFTDEDDAALARLRQLAAGAKS